MQQVDIFGMALLFWMSCNFIPQIVSIHYGITETGSVLPLLLLCPVRIKMLSFKQPANGGTFPPVLQVPPSVQSWDHILACDSLMFQNVFCPTVICQERPNDEVWSQFSILLKAFLVFDRWIPSLFWRPFFKCLKQPMFSFSDKQAPVWPCYFAAKPLTVLTQQKSKFIIAKSNNIFTVKMWQRIPRQLGEP